MGESKKQPLRVGFDRQIKLTFHGATVTSDAGLLACRELDEKLQLTSTASEQFHDTRNGQNTQSSIQAFLRQSIYSRLVRSDDSKSGVRSSGRLDTYVSIGRSCSAEKALHADLETDCEVGSCARTELTVETV